MSGDNATVSDPEDYSTSARLKQIFDARRQMRNMRREASSYRHSGNRHSLRVEAIQHYRSGVESYLLEVDTLLTQHDPGPYLWAEKHYGTVTVRPPGNWESGRRYYRSTNLEVGPNKPLKVKELPEPVEVDVIGLKWLFEAETPVSRPFEFEHQGYSRETVTKTGTAFIAWSTLNEMVTDVNRFLAELGVGLSLDETDEWTI
jgi:hypothetical protein